jgi:hypothetical protein
MKDIFMLVGTSVLDDGTLPVFDYKGKSEIAASLLENAKLSLVKEQPLVPFRVVQVVGTYTGDISCREVGEA